MLVEYFTINVTHGRADDNVCDIQQFFQASVQCIMFHRREARLFYTQVTMYPNVISLHALRSAKVLHQFRALILPRLPVNVTSLLYRRRRANHQYSPGESSARRNISPRRCDRISLQISALE